MKTWYSCKVKSTREADDGHLKQVTDAYLVDAVSYTEAESRIHDLVGQETPGEFLISNISKTNISEVINYEDVDTWFKCKISYVTVDADTEKEVKINTYYLVSAKDVKEAYERVEDSLSSMLVPFEVPSITLTTFVEVFPYLKDDVESLPDNLSSISGYDGDMGSFEDRADDVVGDAGEDSPSPTATGTSEEEEGGFSDTGTAGESDAQEEGIGD